MKKRFLSFFLVLSLLVSLLIPAATAAEAAGEESLEITVTVSVQPEEALVFLTDSQANRVFPNEDGTYTLYQGASYHYNITKSGYVGISEDFIAGEETHISVTLAKAEENPSINPDLPSSWPTFRGNAENNAVVDAPTPQTADDATLYWATKIGQGFWGGAAGSPIIVDDYLVFCSGKKLYKTNRFTGELMEQTGDMVTNSNFNIVPPTYADGMIFVGLSNGTIQAFDAETLESLWVYEDPLKGQPNSPLVYYDGYVYTGFWNSETKAANFVCVSATDENPDDTQEAKYATWTYQQAGGFYWSGAYISDNFVLVGTDDGQSGYLSDTSNLLSLDPKTGKLIDKIGNLNGDIRSSISYDTITDRYYFASKGGSFYSVAVENDGTFSDDPEGVQGYDLKEIVLDNGIGSPNTPPMSTSTPVVHNGRAYIGVAGEAQFVQYGGHNITVIDLESWQIAYTVPVKGYPQTSGLLSTAYEDEEGYAYIYFIDNYTPGQLRVIKDKPGITSVVDGVTERYMSKGQMVTIEGCAPVLFTPSGDQAQYAICSPIVDEEGTLYFKNDSAYMMAVGSRIEKIEVTVPPEKTTYMEGEIFDPSGMQVKAFLANGMERDITDSVTFSQDPLTTADTDITVYYNYVMYGDRFDGENGNETGITVLPPETYINLTVLTTGETSSISHVMDLIAGIGKVTLESQDSIQTAREAYVALPETLQPYVTNYSSLTAAEAEYQTLYAVFSLISEIGEVTYSKADIIEQARIAYDALSVEQRKEITNYQDLLEAEKILTELIADINSVEQQISEIGTVTLSKEKIIEASRQAYDSLPEDSKKGVTNYKDLVNAERTLDALKKEIDDVIASINAIGEVTYAKSSVIQMTREAYTALTEEQQGRVSNYQVLVDAEKLLNQLVEEICSVESKIDAIGVVTLEKETLIQAARSVYEQLPEPSKTGVSNYDVLTAAEAELQSLKKPTLPQEPPTGEENQTTGNEQLPATGEQGQSDWIVWPMLICGIAAFSISLRKKRSISSNRSL
ncbi:MAG: PQQ-binding-like beta-propeller repeat protein [Clostridium sp.]